MIKVLIVGQIPPPIQGQSVMIQQLLEAKYQDIELFHVRMAFSDDIDDIGKVKLFKIFHLFWVIISIIYHRFRYGIQILYYPPAGPNLIPIYRDLAILISVRYFFSKTILHFHASGISELYARLPWPLKKLLQFAYFYPDAAIVLSELNPPDGQIFKAKKNFFIPCGLPDFYEQNRNKLVTQNNECVQLLYVGILRESKGVLVALEAANFLREKDLKFHFKFMGKFQSKQFQSRVLAFVEKHQLQEFVTFLGVQSGIDKWQTYAESDILCFPTFFELESFGLVLLEGMQFTLPTVSTYWRAIPSIVEDGESGYLLSVHDSQGLADKLAQLINNPSMRKEMGKKGREIYLSKYTIDKFHKNLEEVFKSTICE